MLDSNIYCSALLYKHAAKNRRKDASAYVVNVSFPAGQRCSRRLLHEDLHLRGASFQLPLLRLPANAGCVVD